MNRQLRSATLATFVAFGVNGLVFASWASRIPAVADQLQIQPSAIGGLLLFMAVGSLIALPTAGRVVNRIGTTNTIRVAGAIMVMAAVVAASGISAASFAATGAGLAIMGVGIGLWDVTQNIEGADVEHLLKRTIMPQFHAAFSGGAILGALLGAGLSALNVDVTTHLYGIAAAIALTALLVPQHFLPHRSAHTEAHDGGGNGVVAWKELRTLLIGVVVMGATISEGGGNDWIAKATVDGLHSSDSTGALVFAVFVTGMTVVRFVGGGLIDRFGRVLVIRASMITAAAGLILFCYAPNVVLAVIGAILWGAGAALTFPLGMSAAADDPKRAAARVSVVSTVGYVAFLAGPPAIGYLADHVGMRPALMFILIPIVLAALLAGASRPLVSSQPKG